LSFEEAIEDFDMAIKYDKNYASAYVNRGTAREMARDPEGACSDWAKARALGSSLGKKYLVNNCNL
jgi:tetratricopeptide (TPR) repeat protein